MGLQSFKFATDFLNNLETPVIYVAKKDKTIVNSVSVYDGLRLTFNLNAFQTGEFKIYCDIDGKRQDYFNDFEEEMLILIPGIGWYEIHVETNIEQTGISKSITATSLECKLCDKRLIDFECNAGEILYDDYVRTIFYDPTNPKGSLLHRILNVTPNWHVGHVDDSLAKMQRTLDVDDTDVYSFLTGEVSEAFNCLFIFDTFNETVNAYDLNKYGTDTDIFVSMDNLAQNMTETIDQNSIITCYRVNGGDGVYINEVNPNGTNKLYNFEYYLPQMSSDIQTKVIAYNNKYQSLKPQYEDIMLRMQKQIGIIQELNTRLPDSLSSKDWTKYGLSFLESKQKSFKTQDELYCAQGMNKPESLSYNLYKQNLQDLNDVTAELSVRQGEIDSATVVYNSIKSERDALQEQLDMDNWFTEDEWKSLDNYVVEATYDNDNYVVTDLEDDSERFEIERQLYEVAWKDLSKKCRPQYQYSATLANILTIPEFKNFLEYFELGNFIRMETDYDTIVKLRMISFSVDYSNTKTIGVTFSDAVRVHDVYDDAASIQAQANSAAMSFQFNKDHYDKTVKEGNWVAEMRKYGLDVAATSIHNSSNQVQTWDSTGMTFRQWNDERQDYDPEMAKIINNMMVFSDNSMQTVRMGIGKIFLPNGETAYGFNGELVLGKLFLGQYLTLQNDSGTYKFDDTGFSATNGINTVKIQPSNSGELFSIYKGIDKQFYITSDGDVEYAGTLRGATGIFSGLLKGGSIDIGNNSFSVNTDGIFSLAGGRLKFDGKSLSFAPDVTISWNQITDTDNVADKNDIPTDISQLNDMYGQKWSTTIGENWIRTSTITAQNLNVQNLDTINSNGYVKAKTSNQYAALEVACADDGAGIRIYNGTKNSSTGTWSPILSTYSQISSKAITFYDSMEQGIKLSTLSGLDMANHSISNCSGINLISNTTPTSTSTDSVKAPSYSACASMITNIQQWVTSQTYISGINVSTGSGTITKTGSSSYFWGTTNGGIKSSCNGISLKLPDNDPYSDVRVKNSISEMPDISEIYKRIKLHKFKYQQDIVDADNLWHWGILAQPTEELFNEYGYTLDDYSLIRKNNPNPDLNEDRYVKDKIYRVTSNEFHAMHIQMIQKQQKEIEELKQEIGKLKETIKK